MNILITNVGNIRSNELRVLVDALSKKHQVTVACMAVDSSCKGQAFSLSGSPVRVNEMDYANKVKAYEFYSTPADAVSIMLGEILTRKPDLVICGINNGIHMGQDIYHSSNVGMAMESAFFNIPSIAVGIEHKVGGHTAEECANAVKFVEKNIEAFAKFNMPTDSFLNINIPTVEKYSDLHGPRITRTGPLTLINEFEEKVDPAGGKYYWAKNVKRESLDETEDLTGISAFEHGFISITPISYDSTCYETLESLPQVHAKAMQKGGEKL
jgi:5'-nucleotidase